MNVNDDAPPPVNGPRAVRPSRPTRKLSFPSRVRGSLRRGADRVLGADGAWSLAFVVVVTVLLGSQRCGVSFEPYSLGDVARENIDVPYDIHLPDEEETLARRLEAMESVPDLYVHDTERAERLVRELSALFRHGREAGAAQGETDASAGRSSPRGSPAEHLDPATLELLRQQQFAEALEGQLTELVRDGMRGLVIGNRALLEREPEILVAHVPGSREERLADYSEILDLDGARRRVREAAAKTLSGPAAARRRLGELAASFVDANLALDPEGTKSRRDAAAAAVPPVLEQVAKGTVLVREGERITPELLARLDAAREASSGRLGGTELAGLVVVAALLAFFLHRYAAYHQRGFRKIRHLHALLVLVQLSMLLLTQATLWLVGEVVDNLVGPFNEIDSYRYLIPLAAGSIMIALLANGRIAMVHSTFVALLFGAMQGWEPYLITWALLTQWAGIYAISTYRERAALIRAGLVVGGAGALSVVALQAVSGGSERLTSNLYEASLAFLGGAVGVGLVISFTLPMLEGLFRVLTDVRLLELSNLNNPLLSELAVKAPGSYNHSLVVGTLAEEAAKAIGANSLFCRVAAFYHDIGKILKPDYYVENQRGVNPHDRLTPSMSALVVAAHVKDGIRLARENGVPEQIVDIIPQHHGTRLMTYFFEKAKSSADPRIGVVKDEDFRYPGPKPQTREAAIFMLSDAVEAAARTVEEPGPNRLKEMIRKVSNAVVLDGQFDECELTFADLDRIQQALLRTLVGMYHHRVDYPGFDFGKSKSAAAAGELPQGNLARGS